MNNKKKSKAEGRITLGENTVQAEGVFTRKCQTDSFPWEKTLLKWVNNKIERRIRDNKLK